MPGLEHNKLQVYSPKFKIGVTTPGLYKYELHNHNSVSEYLLGFYTHLSWVYLTWASPLINKQIHFWTQGYESVFKFYFYL